EKEGALLPLQHLQDFYPSIVPQLSIWVTVSLRTQPEIPAPSIWKAILNQVRPSALLRSCRNTSAAVPGGSLPTTSYSERVDACERTLIGASPLLKIRH